MKLENTFVVAAPLGRTWALLTDIERVAACLPGANLEPAGEEGVYRGTMRVKLGPVTVTYAGTAQLTEIDVATRTATMAVSGKEIKGQGKASASIRNRLVAAGAEQTRIGVETDLNVTGRPAQFGRGMLEGVATHLLAEFATRLEHELEPMFEASKGKERTETMGRKQEQRTELPALDVGPMIYRSVAKRDAILATGLVVAVLLAFVVMRKLQSDAQHR